MGLFSKPSFSTVDKQNINNLILRSRSAARAVNETDSISTYYSTWDRLELDMKQLLKFEKAGYKFTPSMSSVYKDVFSKRANSEKSFIDRAYLRLQTNLVNLSTTKGKQGRIDAFFNEFTLHQDKMAKDNIAYLNQLKEKAIQSINTSSTSKMVLSGKKFCPACGHEINERDMFCSSCGQKLR